MSRLAKKPIVAPEGITISQNGNTLIFKGPKGELSKTFPSIIDIKLTGDSLSLSSKSNNKSGSALLGTSAAIIKNALAGVKEGYEKKLELEGVGYKVQMDGKNLVLSLGFSHPVRIEAPEGIVFRTEKNSIFVNGIDKERVGQIAAEIRHNKPPEPYKGKGIHYLGEVIRRKAGKKAVASA